MSTRQARNCVDTLTHIIEDVEDDLRCMEEEDLGGVVDELTAAYNHVRTARRCIMAAIFDNDRY